MACRRETSKGREDVGIERRRESVRRANECRDTATSACSFARQALYQRQRLLTGAVVALCGMHGDAARRASLVARHPSGNPSRL